MEIWVALLAIVIAFMGGLGLMALVHARSRSATGELAAHLKARADDQAVIRASIDRLHEQLRDADRQQASWQGQFNQQVDEMRNANADLRRETGALSTALRKPASRGRWGEQHLRRTVELAGMANHCDFVEQQTIATPEGPLRPDLVVHLAGGRQIVVDAKVPLDAYLDAVSTEDPDEQADHFTRHVRQVRKHIADLSSKRYWSLMDSTPEFVVLFVGTQSALATALEHDSQLLDHAAAANVILASPITLIGLLRTIAHGWTTAALAENTREIHELGRQLHERLATMGGHLEALGKSLTGAATAYNKAIGSLESRVLVSARQFEDLQVTTAALPSPNAVTEPVRSLSAPELLTSLTPQRGELDLEDAPARLPDSDADCPSLGA